MKRNLSIFGMTAVLITIVCSIQLCNQTWIVTTTDIACRKMTNEPFNVLSQLKDDGFPIEDPTQPFNPQNFSLPFPGFTENRGQLWNSSIAYHCSMGDTWVGFGKSMVRVTIIDPENSNPIDFSITFPGSNEASPQGVGKKNHNTNYFYGDFHLTNVPAWEEILYCDLYPNIDLRYYMSSQGLKYDFIVHPGGDPDNIIIKISENVALTVSPENASIYSLLQPQEVLFKDTSLRAWQDKEKPIAAYFISKGSIENAYGFQVEHFDRTQVLIIDPLWLPFSTFLGAEGDDWNLGIVVDASGNIYVAGHTNSSAFPTKNAYRDALTGGIGDWDVFVTKLNAAGNDLVFSTFLGGSSSDAAYGVAVDDIGNCYITGHTWSNDFPTKNAYNSTYGGQGDVFVAKLNSAGNALVFSTYLGGSDEWGMGIAVDSTGNCCITGYTNSSVFPTKYAYNSTHGGDWDVFVTKLNAAGNDLVFSTFLGGSGWDEGTWITMDDDGNCYIVGDTNSTNFPVKNANQSTHGGGESDAFVAKFNADGSELIFCTFLGGSGAEYSYGIAVDSDGNSYVTGLTFSSDFPTANAYQGTHGGGSWDCFVAKLNSTGDGLVFSTFFGGSNPEYGFGIAVDNDGNCYIGGHTKSNETDFPVKNAYQNTHGGDWDGFVAKLNATGNGLMFSTFIGGTSREVVYSFTIDGVGNCYVAGYTYSSDFPTNNAYNDTYTGKKDVYVAKLSFDAISPSIELLTSLNESIGQSGTIIHLNLTDDSSGVGHVSYNWDGMANTTLLAPYDVFLPLGDGLHALHVYANDTAGNWAQATFFFTTDDTPPIISLTTPTDGSICRSGTLIYLNVTDNNHVGHVLYHWDNGINTTLESPYNSSLPPGDGSHVLHIFANDSVGNWGKLSFTFITDDTGPLILLDDPENGTIHKSGTVIALNITDAAGVSSASYSWNAGTTPLPVPFNVSLPPGDGQHILLVVAYDTLGNVAQATFVFTTDDTAPVITLNSPVNDTTHLAVLSIISDTIIDMTVVDNTVLELVLYHWDANDNASLRTPYDVRLPASEGRHTLFVYANDTAGNWASIRFTFTTDDPTLEISIGLGAIGVVVAVSVGGYKLWHRKKKVRRRGRREALIRKWDEK